jgi:acyl-coenzyme A synthetase/AMP-(fatty) acid ligase
MFTSGTTGKPKGVMVDHAALLMRTGWMQQAFGLAPGETVPFKTNFIFGPTRWSNRPPYHPVQTSSPLTGWYRWW